MFVLVCVLPVMLYIDRCFWWCFLILEAGMSCVVSECALESMQLYHAILQTVQYIILESTLYYFRECTSDCYKESTLGFCTECTLY